MARSTERPRSDDEDYDDFSYISALSGHVGTAGDEPSYELDDMLLELIGTIQKVDTLLSEAPRSAYTRNATRLMRIRKMMRSLPRASRQPEEPPRRIGFEPPRRRR